ALEQWGLLIGELHDRKWIATGNGIPEGGRGTIAPEQLLRDGLSYDVRDNAIYQTRNHGTWREETFRLVDTVTVEAAVESDIEAAQPGGEAAVREAANESEVRIDPTNAQRQKRHRERKGNVTRNATITERNGERDAAVTDEEREPAGTLPPAQ